MGYGTNAPGMISISDSLAKRGRFNAEERRKLSACNVFNRVDQVDLVQSQWSAYFNPAPKLLNSDDPKKFMSYSKVEL